MELSHLVAFNLALLAALLSPGPAMLYSVSSSITGSTRRGVLAGAGLASMAASWTLLALLGVGALLTLLPGAFLAMKIAGGLYLIYLAWKTWRSADRPATMETKQARNAFIGGLLINFANPKSVLFAGAVLVAIFPTGLTFGEQAFIVANHFAVEMVAYALLAIIMSRPVIVRRYLSAKRWIDRVFAGLMAALGLRLLISHP